MTFGVKSRLFVFSIALVAAVGAVSSVYLEFELRRWLQNRAAVELQMLGGGLKAVFQTETAYEQLDLSIDKEKTVSLWVVDATGQYVYGSKPPPKGGLALRERFARRGDKTHIARDGRGRIEGIYAIVPLLNQGESLQLLLRRSPEEIQKALDTVRIFLLIAGAIALLMSSVLSLFAVKVLSKRLQSILERARAAIEAQRVEAPAAVHEVDVLNKNIDRLDFALEEMLKTLARERYRFEAVLQSIREAVFAVSESGEIVLTNRAAKKLLPKDGVALGGPISELLPHPALNEALQEALSGRSTEVEFELEVDKLRHVLGRITPHESEGGAVIVLNDVTRLRRLETMRRDFVANVSHELRTPVSVIRLNAEALRDGALKDEKNGMRFVEATLRHAERLSNLVSDLLDISRLESGRYEDNAGWLNLDEVLGSVIEDIRPLAEERSMVLKHHRRDELEVMADQKALEQVLTNLIQNAVKYSDKPNTSVTIESEVLDAHVVVRIKDEGPGIAPEHHPRIFERFYRVDAGRSKHMGGTGLGLAIVKHLVANFEGKVGLYSNEPRGTVFWFTLQNFRRVG